MENTSLKVVCNSTSSHNSSDELSRRCKESGTLYLQPRDWVLSIGACRPRHARVTLNHVHSYHKNWTQRPQI